MAHKRSDRASAARSRPGRAVAKLRECSAPPSPSPSFVHPSRSPLHARHPQRPRPHLHATNHLRPRHTRIGRHFERKRDLTSQRVPTRVHRSLLVSRDSRLGNVRANVEPSGSKQAPRDAAGPHLVRQVCSQHVPSSMSSTATTPSEERATRRTAASRGTHASAGQRSAPASLVPSSSSSLHMGGSGASPSPSSTKGQGKERMNSTLAIDRVGETVDTRLTYCTSSHYIGSVGRRFLGTHITWSYGDERRHRALDTRAG